MESPAEDRLQELADQLRTLQRQTGELELAAKDRKKPWWRQPALLISLASLSISSSLSLYTQFDQARQRRSASLEGPLAEIVALRLEDTKQMGALAATNPAAYRAWVNAAVVKRASLIDAVMGQISQQNVDLSPTSALTIGNELIQDGRYGEAEAILAKAVESAAHAKSSPASLLSSLAQVYLLPGSPLLNPSKGRGLYRRAIEAYPNQGDYYVLNAKMNLILFWAANEYGFGNAPGAAGLINEAQKIAQASALPPAARNLLDANIDAVRKQLQMQSPGPNLLNSQLAGRWRVDETGSAGSSLLFTAGPGAAFAFAKSRLTDGKVSERLTGAVLFVDGTHLRLEWSAGFDTGVPGWQKAGYSEVELRGDQRLHGTDFAVGLPPKQWSARRAETATSGSNAKVTLVH